MWEKSYSFWEPSETNMSESIDAGTNQFMWSDENVCLYFSEISRGLHAHLNYICPVFTSFFK